MTRTALLALLLALAGGAAAAPAHWRQAGPVEDAREVSMTWAVALPEAVAARLEARLLEVSDPDSPSYGRYYSSAAAVADGVYGADGRAEVARRLEAVLEFLERGGVRRSEARVHGSGDSVSARLPAGQLAALLRTRLCDFEHVPSGTRVTRECEGHAHALPPALEPLVAAVSPLRTFPVTRRMVLAERRAAGQAPPAASAPASADSGGQWPNGCSGGVKGLQCGGWITPAVLASRYAVPPQQQLLERAAAAANSSGPSSLALVEFSGQLYNQEDLTSFSSICEVSPEVRVSAFYGDEGQAAPGADKCGIGFCSESELDIEFGGAMFAGAALSVIYDSNYDLLAYATNASALASPPLVQSVSYGLDEADQPSEAYIRRVSQEFMRLSLRGVSVVVASGDGGAYGRDCTGGAKLCPTFPATSPWVTAVGGTYFSNNAVGDEACTSWSGGGFSSVFASPSYQRDAVTKYLGRAAGSLPPASSYNATGRAFPDVAAISGSQNPYCVYLSGSFQSAAGTSASAPVVAGILARVNSVRLAAGRPPLGLANPLLYKNPGAFHDVTSGNNAANGEYGFPAAEGYDACSGLGTPNFAKLSVL